MKNNGKLKRNLQKTIHFSLILLTFLCFTIIYCTSINSQDIYAGDDYIQITTTDELLNISKNPDKNYILANDIDLSDIPCENTAYIAGNFSGTFNGNNKTISGAQIFIFENITENAVIEKLNITGTLKLEGHYVSVGLLALDNKGTIKDCSVTATGMGKTGQYIYSGMMAYFNYGVIENCRVELNFNTEEDLEGGQFGGFACANHGLIKNSTISGSINADTLNYEMDFGGIACDNYSEIIDCTNNCNVTGNISAGGIVNRCGSKSSYIYNCDNYGSFDVQYLEHNGIASSPTGGIAGEGQGCIIGCTNYGKLSANDAGAAVGGIIGNNYSDCVIDSCINNGNISTNKSYSGGICAKLSFSSGSFNVMDEFVSHPGIALIKNCINYGEITAAGEVRKKYGILGYGYQSNDSLIAIDNCKSYTGDTEDELTYNDTLLVNNSDSEININEDKLVLLYNEAEQMTGDFSVDSVDFFCTDFPVSETGMVKGETNFNYVDLDAIIESSVVVAVDKNTGATDYCIIEVRNGGVTYEYMDGVLTFSGNGALPFNYNYDYEWEEYRNDTTKIVFEEGVGSIPIYAFWYFENLEEVEFADSIVYIGIGAFTGCKNLKNIILPDRLYTLQTNVFAQTGIESITIPEGMLEIYSNVFENCNKLKTINFEGEVSGGIGHIDSNAFNSCPALEQITVPEGCYSLESIDGVLYQNTLKGKVLLRYPSAKKDTTFTLPSDVYYIPFNVLNENAYLENFYGGTGLKYVEDNNFSNCKKLKTIVIPENVERFSINFDLIDYIENIKNNSSLTISLGSEYVYLAKDTQEQVTLLEAGQEVTRYKPVAPAKVTVKTRTTTNGINVIKWSKVEGADGYVIMRKSLKSAEWKDYDIVEDGSIERYEDKYVLADNRYYYTVKAYSNDEITGETVYGAYENDPVGVIASVGTAELISLTSDAGANTIIWTSIPGVQGYVIKRKTNGGKWINLAVLKGSGRDTYVDSKAIYAGSEYTYTVFAMGKKKSDGSKNYGGFSKAGLSVEASVKTVILKSLYSLKGKNVIKWNKVNGADGYIIYRKTDNTEWVPIKTIRNGATLKYNDTAINSKQLYYYTVKAYYTDENGNCIYGKYDSEGKSVISK